MGIILIIGGILVLVCFQSLVDGIIASVSISYSFWFYIAFSVSTLFPRSLRRGRSFDFRVSLLLQKIQCNSLNAPFLENRRQYFPKNSVQKKYLKRSPAHSSRKIDYFVGLRWNHFRPPPSIKRFAFYFTESAIFTWRVLRNSKPSRTEEMSFNSFFMQRRQTSKF